MSGSLECMHCGGFYSASEWTDDGGLAYVGRCPNCGRWNVATLRAPPEPADVKRDAIGVEVTTHHNQAVGIPPRRFTGDGWRERLDAWLAGDFGGVVIREVYE